MNTVRERASISVSNPFSSLPKHNVIRRTQSSSSGLAVRSLRVVVLGVGGVGKTALSVRYVTNRFIGDYDPTLETIYRHTALIDGEIINFEIMDTAGQEDGSVGLEDKCKWGESFIFMYDVTDQCSFDELARFKFVVSYTHNRMRQNFEPCLAMVGNKCDLAKHERMIEKKRGEKLAGDLGCHIFREISVKESVRDASSVFEDIWRQFSSASVYSPSNSHRRKLAGRLQEKIPILESSISMYNFFDTNRKSPPHTESSLLNRNSTFNFQDSNKEAKSRTKSKSSHLNRNFSMSSLYHKRRGGFSKTISVEDVFQTPPNIPSNRSLSTGSSSSETSIKSSDLEDKELAKKIFVI